MAGWSWLGIGLPVPEDITVGTGIARGFLNDNVLHSPKYRDIHYSSYIPESYDGSKPYALFITLPGWEGLYFQGVGSLVMGKRPELYTAYLMTLHTPASRHKFSQWLQMTCLHMAIQRRKAIWHGGRP